MCVFTNKINEKEIDCYFSKIDYLINTVPLDEVRLCVFHSENELWKSEHNFTLHLEELINYFEEESMQKNIFLEDVFFIGNTDDLFNNKRFKKNVSFKYSIFNEDLNVNSSMFSDLSFESAIFNKRVSFVDLSIKQTSFKNANFKSNFQDSSLQGPNVEENYLRNFMFVFFVFCSFDCMMG